MASRPSCSALTAAPQSLSARSGTALQAPHSGLRIQAALLAGLACSASALACLVATPAVAQTTAAASTHAYQIPAGPLADVLRQFANQAGAELTASNALVEGKTSQGLSGSYSIAAGFTALLQEHQLQATRQSNGSYTLAAIGPAGTPAAAADGSVLPEVVVTAALNHATENSDSYTQSQPITAATGMAMTAMQTPQSISVVTRQQIEDWNLSSLQDIAKVTPGLYFKNSGVSEQESQAYARGFVISQVNVDGQALGTGNFNGRAIGADLAMYDSVEVVRGATGLLQGMGEPSGSINLVRKRPTAQPLLNVSASLGSWRDKRLTLDTSRALNDAGTLRARLVASGQDSHSFVDVTKERNGLLYGIIEADLSPTTQLAFGASTQKTRTDGLFRGLPSYSDGSHIGLPRSTYLDTSDTFQQRDTDIAFAELRQRLDKDWSLKAVYTYADGSSDARYTNNSRIAGSETTLELGETGWKYTTRQHNLDVRANGSLQSGSRTHELVFGASLRKDDVDWMQTWDGASNGRTIDIYNWNPYANQLTGSRPANGLQQQRSSTEKGLFAAGNFELTEPLHLVIGGRLSWFKEKGTGGWYSGATPAMRQSLHESAVFIPYLGLVYDLHPNHSVYASLTEIFTPQSAQDVTGNTLKPITGTNYEVGIKSEYFDGGLNTSAAIFRVVQRNRAVRDDANCPTGGIVSCSRAAGEIQSEGIELQVSGALTPAWQIGAGYTFVNAKYTQDAVASNIGQRVSTDEPRNLFKLVTSYRLPGALNQWTVQGSLEGQSTIYTQEPGYYTSQKGYLLVGLGAGYRVNSQLHVQAQIDNLFDKTYYTGLGASWSGSGARYGTPRSVLVTAKYSF